MKNEKGITLVALMVYIVTMAMVVLTVTNITRYFYNNVRYTDNTTEYSENYLKFMAYISKEINVNNNTILDITETSEDLEDGNEEEIEQYVIFSKTYNQYTFKENAIYKNQEKICENIRSCEFIKEKDNQLTINLEMTDGTQYNNTYTIITY